MKNTLKIGYSEEFIVGGIGFPPRQVKKLCKNQSPKRFHFML